MAGRPRFFFGITVIDRFIFAFLAFGLLAFGFPTGFLICSLVGPWRFGNQVLGRHHVAGKAPCRFDVTCAAVGEVASRSRYGDDIGARP